MANSEITFKTVAFDGDASLVDIFFNQIKTLTKAHKWKDKEAIQYLGSKLAGPKLAFFTHNSSIYNADNLKAVKKELKKNSTTS